MKQLVIYGAWYFGKVVREAAEAAGWDVLGFVDPDPPADVVTLSELPPAAAVFVAIGDNAIRASVSSRLLAKGRSLTTVVHPTASVSPSARLGAGTYVGELVAVRTNVSLGEGVVLQAGAVVSHDCSVASHASFGPNATAASKVRIGARTIVGAGSVIAPGLVIANDCTVAAGAAVFKDAVAQQSLVGNPARAVARPEKTVIQSDWEANNVW